MIPGMTVLGCIESICVCLVGSDAALCNAIDSVSIICMKLADTVKMSGRSLVGELVLHMNN